MKITLKQTTWAIFFSFLSLFILGLADNIRGPLFPEILAEFNLSNTLGSWSFATTSSAAFVGSWISHYFLKKFPISTLLLLSVLLMGIGLGWMGTSNSFGILLIGCFILGLSIGFMGVSQNLLVSESVPEDKRSRALSALHGMYGLSSFIAPILASLSASHFGSWRGAFIVTSIISVVFFLFQFLFKSNPKFSVVAHESSNPTSEADVSVNVNSDQLLDKKNDQINSDHQPSKKALITIGGMFAFYVVAEILVSTRLALYMRTYFQMNLDESSFYVTLFFLFLLLGRVAFAFLKLSIPLKKQLNISLLLSIILLILGLKFHPLFLALVGLGMAPYYPLCVSYIAQLSGSMSRSFIAFAMSMQSLSVVSMHLGVGYITDTLGLASAFGVGILALGLSLICLNTHPEKLT